MNWKKRKAYNARRAEVLGKEMDEAIADRDKDRFRDLYVTAMYYMKKKERSVYFKRFLKEVRNGYKSMPVVR